VIQPQQKSIITDGCTGTGQHTHKCGKYAGFYSHIKQASTPVSNAKLLSLLSVTEILWVLLTDASPTLL